MKSIDGGKTFRPVRGMPHGDSHDIWIDPKNPNRMIEGDDGGANVSIDGGTTWTDEDFATAQFYHVVTTTHFPYRVCGAQQDNSHAVRPEPQAVASTSLTGSRRAAASRATSRRATTTRTSSTPAATAICSRARTCSTGITRQRQSVARQSDGPSGDRSQVPLPVDLPDRRLEAQLERRLRRLATSFTRRRTAARAGR